MFNPEQHHFERFNDKVWLSSPTMHGLELVHMREAYETNWMSTIGENINEVEKQIAEKLGLPMGTVKSRLFFIRKRLKEELKDFS